MPSNPSTGRRCALQLPPWRTGCSSAAKQLRCCIICLPFACVLLSRAVLPRASDLHTLPQRPSAAAVQTGHRMSSRGHKDARGSRRNASPEEGELDDQPAPSRREPEEQRHRHDRRGEDRHGRQQERDRERRRDGRWVQTLFCMELDARPCLDHPTAPTQQATSAPHTTPACHDAAQIPSRCPWVGPMQGRQGAAA